MGSPVISQQKILAATRGNPDLLEVLSAVSNVATQTRAVIGTTPSTAPVAGQPSAGARVPSQAYGTVSLLGTNYIVQIVNPGATSPISQTQAQQASASATQLTPLQPVTPIYHQIRASTSPAFNVNSNTQMFGGNTGSTQTYWTLTGLGSGTWFFQFRSSFDGINFNTWRNVNSGAALGGLINQVTEETVGDAQWALFTMPGSMITGVGRGLCFDGEVFDLATQLYSSGLFAVAAPDGGSPLTSDTCGITECNLVLQTPSTGNAGIVGVPDFPVLTQMEYGVAGGLPAFMAGSAKVFGIAVDPSNENVTLIPQNGGTPTTNSTWAVIQLPGGARLSIGQGLNNHGDTIWTPPSLSWISGTDMISISSLTGATDTGKVPDGYYANSIDSSFVLSAQYHDIHGNIWATQANWLMICWQPGAATLTAGGNTFVVLNLQGDHSVILGAGTCASMSVITLPGGYIENQTLGLAVPNGGITNPGNHNLSGIVQCSLDDLIPTLFYGDTAGNEWSGNVNWMIAAWL